MRHQLKVELDVDHAALDARYGQLDLTSRAGLGTFLRAHRAAFGAISDALPASPGRVTPMFLGTLVAALDADLAVLGLTPPVLRPARRHDARAIDHVVLGSRLGTKVLRKRWSKAQAPILRAAGHYFATSTEGEAWRAHCIELSELPAHGPDADRICADCRSLFLLFADALDATEW